MSIKELIENAVSELPPAHEQRVLEFINSLRHELEDEDKALGEAGLKVAATILEPEDFSDWEKPA